MKLTKHHGLGNDFLVLVDLDGTQPGGSDLARAACDRHTGVGADGLIRASAAEGADARMELWNADGSPAELSGNGLRCLGQALVLTGVAGGGELTLATAGGRHRLEVRPTEDPAVHRVIAEMGRVAIEDAGAEWRLPGVVDAARARIGNPHLVLHVPEPTAGPDLDEVGRRANREIEGGVNVEVIRPDAGGLVLEVFERGVGRTRACGTGACAASAVARSWGLVGDRVTVRMPGGTAEVGLGDPVTLGGPVHAVAEVGYPWS